MKSWGSFGNKQEVPPVESINHGQEKDTDSMKDLFYRSSEKPKEDKK
jgi:hypothetical protein